MAANGSIIRSRKTATKFCRKSANNGQRSLRSFATFGRSNMFDLERAITEWRKQMVAAGVKNGEVLSELESHLRDDIQREIQAGLTAQRAFKIAVERIGGAQAIKSEFAKIGRPPMALLRRLQSFLFGSNGVTFPPLNAFTADARQTLELAREEAPRLNHDF